MITKKLIIKLFLTIITLSVLAYIVNNKIIDSTSKNLFNDLKQANCFDSEYNLRSKDICRNIIYIF